MECLLYVKCQKLGAFRVPILLLNVRWLVIQLIKFIGKEVPNSLSIKSDSQNPHQIAHDFNEFTFLPTDGQTLPINRRQKAYNNGTLIIEQLQRAEDAGTYTCMAQNKQKQAARRNVEILVLSK